MAKVLYRKVAKLALRLRKRFLSSPLPFLGCHTHLRTRSLRMPWPLVQPDEDPSIALLPPAPAPEDKPQHHGPVASEKRDGHAAPTAVVPEKAKKDKTAASEMVPEKAKMAEQAKKDKNTAAEMLEKAKKGENAVAEMMPEQLIKKDYCNKAEAEAEAEEEEEEERERESVKEDHNSNDNGKERERQTSEKERDKEKEKEKEKEDEEETAMMMMTTESTYSYDPCADFRQSMVEMLTILRKRNGDAANGMIHGSELHNLCRAYLLVNPIENHGFIEMAFRGLLLDLYFGLV